MEKMEIVFLRIPRVLLRLLNYSPSGLWLFRDRFGMVSLGQLPSGAGGQGVSRLHVDLLRPGLALLESPPKGVGGYLLADVEIQPLPEVVQEDVDLFVEDEGLLGLRGLLPFILLPGWFFQEVLLQSRVGLLARVAGVAHVDLLADQK